MSDSISDDYSDSFVLIQSEIEQDGESDFLEEQHSMDEEPCDSFDETQHFDIAESYEKRVPLQRHGVECKLCLEDIRGQRWICLQCADWSLCKSCFHGVANEVHPRHTFVCAHSADDIYMPLATSSIATPMVHLDVLCSSCQSPILGTRYECIADECQRQVNLCQSCESLPLQSHKDTHPMVKYRVPKERVASSSLLDYDNEHEQKKRKAFESMNQPKQIGNRGYWKLSKTKVVNQAALNIRNLQGMNIVKDKETPWGSHLSPEVDFARSWEIRNTGSRPWPKGTSVTRISSAVFSPAHFRRRMVSDDVVPVDGTVEIRFVGLTTPSAPRTYIEVWAMSDCEDRLFGERLEIRITVGEDDKNANNRYYGLREVMKDTKEAKEDLVRERVGVGRGEPCKMRVISSVLDWQKDEQTLGCKWNIQNVGKMDFPHGCQLRRISRTVGTGLTIDDSGASFSVPQGLRAHEYATIEMESLKVIFSPKAEAQNHDETQKELQLKLRPGDLATWFTDTWIMVDRKGTEFGEKLYFAQSFQCSDLMHNQGTQERKIVPEGTWKGKGNSLYRSSTHDEEIDEEISG